MKDVERDIGHGVTIKTVTYQGTVVGLEYWHPTPDGKNLRCPGFIYFKGMNGDLHTDDTMEWDVISLEPLTLSPSLLCRGCGHHGHIQNGRWEPVS